MEMIPFIWAVIGILLMGSEFLIPGFIIFFFGAGSLLNGLLTWLIPPLRMNIPIQLLIWALSSTASLLTFRRYFKKTFQGKLISGSVEEEFIGRKVKVLESISPETPGRIEFEGTSWQAISYSETIPAGVEVEILQQEDMSFVVTRSLMDGLPEET